MPVVPPEYLDLIAVGVVIWVVALTVALSFYIPVLRAASERRAENQPLRKDMAPLG
jgi:hypothetical protein